MPLSASAPFISTVQWLGSKKKIIRNESKENAVCSSDWGQENKCKHDADTQPK